MDFSPKITKTSKKLRLSVEEVAMSELMAIGWEQTDAYIVTFNKGLSKSESELRRITDEIVANPSFRKHMEDVNLKMREENIAASKRMTGEDDTFIEQSSKEYTLRQLVAAREAFQPGSSDWLKINQQIIDVTQMKKDEIKEEDNTIHYFLPLRCYQCALFQRESDKKARKQQ